MPQGKVRWFYVEKGYGFISPSDEKEGADVFVHLRDVIKSGLETLEKGQPVEYQVYVMGRGKHKGKISAKDIKLLNSEPHVAEEIQ